MDLILQPMKSHGAILANVLTNPRVQLRFVVAVGTASALRNHTWLLWERWEELTPAPDYCFHKG